MTGFDLLAGEVAELAKERFSSPTPVQEAVIPEILKGRDCLVIAETGSGKTEACLLPIFSLWTEQKPRPASILYITPLRALNRDLLKRLLWWGQKLDLDISVRHGDTSPYERLMQAENPADMLISTPETLQAILLGKKLRKALENLRWIVIDELHELLPSKRGIQLSIGLERLKSFLKQKPQLIALSATLGNPEEAAEWLNKDCKIVNTVPRRKPRVEILKPKPEEADYQLAEKLLTSPELAARLRTIKQMVDGRDSVLIFTNTREWAEILASRLRLLGLEIDIHHSSLSKEARITAENRLKTGKLKGLVCTSSLELGIDIGRIDFILQYGSPRQVGKLIQRIGRSGHSLDRISQGCILVTDLDDELESRAILNLAEKGWLEPVKPYPKAFDVLCHQLCGILLEHYKLPARDAFELIRKAKPFESLGWQEFLDLCGFMQKLGYLWLNPEEDGFWLKRRKGAFDYYYSNLSTIPDVRNFRVIDLVTQQPIGTLDAEFVALHGNPDQVIIFKGRPWRIVEIGEKVLVEPTEDLTGAIPAWEGELIPVPKEVAEDVARIRKGLKLKDQLIIPDNRTILFEWGKESQGLRSLNFAVIHLCGGSQVNEAIGQALAFKLSQKFGSVAVKTDPYRIILRWQGGSWRDCYHGFKQLKSRIRQTLELALPFTQLFAWRFYQVGQRFGIISRKADLSRGLLRKLMETYRDTPVWQETLNELFQEKLDVEGAEEILKGIKKIEVREGLSPLGKLGLKRAWELVGLARPEPEIFKAFKERILETKIGLLCCHCAGWKRIVEVRDLPELKCPLCGSKLIAAVPWRKLDEAGELVRKANQRKRLNKQEERRLDRILSTAYLVISHGKQTVLCLAGRGIGPQTASRILAKQLKGDDLLKEILKAEKEFARTRLYWKS